MPDKFDTLFDGFVADGLANESDRAQFKKSLLAPGKQGYEARYALYKGLKDDGMLGDMDYNQFRNAMGVHATTKQQNAPSVYQKAQGGGGLGQAMRNVSAKVQQSRAAGQPQAKVEQAPQVQQNTQPWQQPWELDMSEKAVMPFQREDKRRAEAPISPQTGKAVPKKDPVKEEIKDIDRAAKGDKAAAKRVGVTAAQERMRDEMDYYNATGAPLRSEINIPITAPTVARDENGEMILGEDGKPLVGLTTDEDRVAQYQQQEREWKLNDVLSKAFKEADKGLEARTIMALEDSENERNENPLMFALSHMSPQSTNVYQQQQEQTLNKGISPEALWGAVNSNNFIEKLLQNEEISKMASSAGMSQEEYAQKVLLPRVAEHYDKYLTEKYDIKGFGEYLMNRALGSMTGNILSGGVQTKGQMQMRGAAVERAHEGLGTYKPGIAGRLAGEVAMFAPDAPELMATGVFGEAAASAVGGGISLLGEKLKRQGLVAFGRLASSGSPFLAANVGRATKWGGLAANRALGGTGLGMFMGTSGAIQDMNVGDGSLASIGKAFASGFAEGSATGALLGVTNLGAQTGASRITGNSFASKASRAGLFGTAFVAENQLFANMDRFKEEDFDWVDSSMDAFYMQLAGKVASGHSMAESMKGVARLFSGKAYSEKPKSGLSWQSDGFRLNDSERAEIERAFGGTELSKIAANPENVGKILGDKQNISWKTRQKVSGSMGMLEPTRPYTESVLVMDKQIDERGANRELIETHTFETEEQKQEILAKIQDRINDTQMWNDFAVLGQRKNVAPTQSQIENARAEILADMQKRDPKYDASNLEEGGADYQAVIDRANEKNNQANILVETVANDYGKTAKEVYDAMYKEPVERTFEEQSILDDLAARMHEAAYPEGEFHPSQSGIDAKKMVGDGPVIDPRVSAELSRRVDTATNEYNQFMQSHQNILEGVTKLGNVRPDEVLMFIADNYSGSERDEGMRVVSNYYNALAAKEAAMEKVADNIENYVTTEVDRRGFKGMLDGAPDVRDVITITDGEIDPDTGQPRELVLLNGDVGSKAGLVEGVRIVDPEKSGQQIICRDENGEFVILKPDAKISFVEQVSKEDFANVLRQELGVRNTQTVVETGLEKVPEPAEGPQSHLQEGDLELWPQVKEWLDAHPDATVGQIQREFRIGFNKATRMHDEYNRLKQAGGQPITGGQQGAQPAVEAGREQTGADEAAGETPAEAATTSQQSGQEGGAAPAESAAEYPVDKDGVKRYEQVNADVDAAIEDLQKDQIDPTQMADAMISEAEETIKNIGKKKNPKPADIVKDTKARLDAQQVIDYWTKLKNRVAQQHADEIARKTAEEEAQRRAAAEAAALQARQKQEAELSADERFKANRERFSASREEGDEDSIVLANGETIEGRYVLVDADAVTPSHNPRGNFAKSEGFPVDENGKTINDRDYENDKTAQVLVQKRSQSYDQRAVNTPVVVSEDGIVLSGNDRTMSGQLAADNKTDGAYVDYITKHAKKWGFTPEQVAGKKNPRIVFVPNEKMEYNAETFAKFNQDEKKSQSKLETSVKMGKVLATKPETLGRIGSIIGQVENLSDLYSDVERTKDVLLAMKEGGLITDEGIARLTDENGLLSAQGKDEFETMLAGVVVDEDALRILNNPANSLGDLRRSIAYAVVPLVKNQTLGEYSIVKDVSEAVRLYDSARKAGLIGKDGDITNYFVNKDAFDGAPMDTHSLAQLLLANQMSKGGYHLKRVIEKYNKAAQPAANKELDWTVGGIRSKEDILSDILKEVGYDAESIKERVERLKETQPPVESDSGSREGGTDRADDSKGEGSTEPERKPEQVTPTPTRPEGQEEEPADKAATSSQQREQDEYLKPRNEKEKEIVKDVLEQLQQEIGEAVKERDKAASALEKARAEESDKATDLFSDDNAFKKEGQLFDSSDMPTDRSQEGVDKRTSAERERLNEAQAKLDKLQSEAERNSRVRGALDNERKQTKIEESTPNPSQEERDVQTNPIEAIEEAATEFKKEQDKEVGITHDETPEQKADRENAEKFADTPITADEIDGANISDVEKTLAKAYLNGNQGFLQKAAYLKAYDNVRNRRQDGTGDSLDAESGTQLDSGENQREPGSGRVGESAVPMDEAKGGVADEGQKRLADGKGQSDTPVGERGDRGVSGAEPSVDGLPSGGERPEGSRESGGTRRDVRGAESDKGSGKDTPKPAAGSDAAIAAARERFAELRKRFKQAGRNGTMSISLAGMNAEQISILMDMTTAAADIGYQYLVRGVREFKEWNKQMLEELHDWVQEDMKWSDAEIDEYLNEVWNCEYNVDGVTRSIREWASFIGEKELKKIVKADRENKFEAQKAAEGIEVKTGDIDNIRETLPFLLPEQQDDVLKAETQFFDEKHQDREHGNGKGMMFTNGTGTGKTYTGLGIVKRFVKQGKGRVLILTPSQEKVTDWANDGLNLGLNVEKLDDIAKAKGTTATKSKGTGVVVTTYANARQNLALLEDCFDLIVYDESHKITEGKEAAEGEMYKFHQMLTNKDVEKSIDRQTYWLPEWIEYRNLVKEREENRKMLDNLDNYDNEETVKVDGNEINVGELRSRLNARMLEIENRFGELQPIMQEIRESKRGQAEIDSKRTKTVFLSATPFNTRENMKYAEGYLFSYPEEDPNTVGSYNHRSPEDAFLERYFPAGYRWRYGRLESHVSNAEALGRQEIDFSDYLQNQLGTLSGRMISSDYDYSRDFPIMTLDHAGRFNQAMSEVYRNKRYNAMSEAFRKSFDYNYSTALFEAMKTSLVIDRIKEHLKRGQKVVVFHRRRTSGDLEPPFERALNVARVMAEVEGQNGNQKGKQEILNAVKAFSEDFADMLEWEKGLDYTLPRDQIAKVFGEDNVGFFSGAENKKTKHGSVEDFMKDNGGKDIIVIQEASGKEGISLHDQTGEHQRVEINLALPQSPIAFIQIEGRIYRIGQKSNAIFEYPLLGLDLETDLFAQKFNSALGTTENLALGSKARNLRKSIANSILLNTGEVDYDRQGLGGKDMDGQVASRTKDGFDDAINDYYGNQKMQRGRGNREGYDYFPTPEPVGFKMVEWGQLMEGESALEPSAGHGAIARYVPETNALTAIEPSADLFSKLQLRAGGPGRRFEEKTFEDYPLANKHDVIVMNPPYGTQGKMAMEHVEKAFKHLNEGGRLIAIIPDGPAMEKRFDAWLNSTGADRPNGSNVLVGEVKLPDVAFGRAGTNVRTRIVVIDKVSRPQMREGMPEQVSVDLSGAATVEDMFEELRHVNMPERTIDQAAIAQKQALKTKKAFEDNKFARDVDVDEHGISVGNRSSYGSVPSLRINFDQIDNPRQRENLLVQVDGLISARDNVEMLDYGRWKNKTYGSGKNAVPAVEAIRDYCDTAIKTIANVLKTTPDGLEKEIKAMKAEAERRRLEREAERQRAIEQREREHEEKVKSVIETALKENGDNQKMTPQEIAENIRLAHGQSWSDARTASAKLRAAGIDWETGHQIVDKMKTLEASYNEQMPLSLETMKRLMVIADTAISAGSRMSAKRALEMSGIHSDTGEAKEGFDYSSHDEYYEKDLRGFLGQASPFSRLKTKIQEQEERKPAPAAPQPAKKEAYEYKLDQNTKTGADMHLVVMNERVDDATYKDLQRKAKALNDGYYNRFKKAWHFKTEEDARKFMEQAGALKGTRFSEEPAKKTPKTVFSEELEKKKRKEYLIEAGKGYSKEEFGEIRKSSIGKSVDGENADKILHTMKNTAEEMPAEVEFTDENYEKVFGNGVETPIGHVKMSDNQKTKLADNYRTRQIALAKRTLESPDMIIEKPSSAKEGQKTERPSTYVFVKTFRDKEGKLATYYFSVTVQRDGMEVSMSNYIPEEKQVKRDMREGKLAYIKEVTLPSESGTSEQGDQHTLPAGAVSSESKDRNNSDAIQENGQEIGKINNSGTKFKEGTDVSGLPEHAQKLVRSIEKTAKKLNTPVKIARSIDEVTNKDALKALREGRIIKGWFEEGTGEIVLYLPNIADKYSAMKTVAHEVVGHNGLRALLGEEGYRSYMRTLWLDMKDESLSKYIKENYSRHGDIYTTIDEYLAEAAEKGYGKLPMWQKVRDVMTDALRKAGFEMTPSISDVKYMVWLSKHRLESGNPVNAIERNALLHRLNMEKNEARVRNGEFSFDDEAPAVTRGYFPGGKTLFRSTPSAKTAKWLYEKALSRWGYSWKESHVDKMQAAVELMRAISGVKKIEDIPSVENFVLAENQISSKEEQIDYLFNRDYMEPLTKAVAAVLPEFGGNTDKALRNLQVYMVKKSGLERNRCLYVRDKIREYRKDADMDQNAVDQLEDDWNQLLDDIRDDIRKGAINLREYLENMDAFIRQNIDANYKADDHDYSGLTAMTGSKKGYDDSMVIDDVMDDESMVGEEKIKTLWEKTKAVSQYGLDAEYEGGLDSKEKHDKVSKMFEWYVPMRGYDETRAEEVYDYLEENKGSEFVGPVLMNAKGRESLSNVDIFAQLGAMSCNAVHRALKNQMKQSFARFVRNHYDKDGKDRLVTELKYLWGEKRYDPNTGASYWEEVFPDIPENATADDVAKIVEDFENDMKAKEATGDAKRMRQNSSIPFRMSPKNKPQHIVEVYINGEKKTFIVNGNPRAAQAINGELNPETNHRVINRITRTMAQLNTSYNPDFVVGNTERDYIFSSAAILAKESPKYFANWQKNYFGRGIARGVAGVPMMHTNLFKRYRQGNLDMSNETDRYFKEFMENGGETGWVEQKNLEKWRKEIKQGVKTQGTAEKAGRFIINAIPEAIEAMNERAENAARFATYMTSRQMGRSITRSVSDAKEVSVNFNRKGAGLKAKDFAKNGSALRKMNAIAAARTAQYGQDYLMFYNAGVQGLNNAAKILRDHPIKASTIFAGFALGAFLMSNLNKALIDDEDPKERGGIQNPYAELPEWIRRNRLCLYAGKGEFITVDLPIELRALYGIGDIAAAYTTHPELRSQKPVWQDVMTQITQILPVDFMGEHPGEPWMSFVPSFAMPFAEVAMNQNWYGRKIEKDQYIDENDPRWTRAYRNANRAYIDASKGLNAGTNRYSEEDLKKMGIKKEDVGNVDAQIKGAADGKVTDPAIVEHIVNGYFGGAGQTAGRLAAIAKGALQGENIGDLAKSPQMPIVRRLHYSPTEQNKMARTRNKWWHYKDEMDEVMNEVKLFGQYGVEDPISKMKQISVEDSARATRASLMKDAQKQYKALKKLHDKMEEGPEKEAVQMRMDQLMENTVMGLDSIR